MLEHEQNIVRRMLQGNHKRIFVPLEKELTAVEKHNLQVNNRKKLKHRRGKIDKSRIRLSSVKITMGEGVTSIKAG